MPGDHIAVPTKITRPLCHDIFPRTRLYNLLNQSLDKPALWISGPPGSGKTTLISGYVDQSNLQCIWYQLDAEDGDPSTFFYYLAKSTEHFVGKNIHVPPFTSEYYENPLSFTRWYLEQLCTQFSSHVVLVFDNYQELPSDSVIHNIIETIIEDLPQSIQLIILSRDTLPATLIRLKLNGKIGTVSWEDLQLTFEESEGILTRSGQISRDKMSLLHEKSSGWVAGLLLLVAGLDMRAPAADFIITEGVKEEIFQYFATEIFNRLDKLIRNFLLRTSLFPHMTITMARELSGLDNAAEIILTLNKHNYFIFRRPGVKSTYQYHPLFREFLLTRAERELPALLRKQLLEKAALLLQDSGEIEEAASLFIQATSWQHLVQLILEHAFSLNSQGRVRLLSGWIEQLPDTIRTDSPWLLYWFGVCRIFIDPYKSTPLLEKAYELFSEKQDIPGLFLSWSAIINSILFKAGSFSPFKQWIKEFDKLRKYQSQLPLEIQAPVTVSMLYALGLSSPDFSELEEWVERGRKLVEQDIDPVSKAQIYNMLIMMYAFRGDLANTEYYLNIFENFAESQQIPPISIIQLKNCIAYYSWLTGRFDQCDQSACSGLKIAEQSGVHLYDHYFWGQLTAGSLSQNREKDARQYLQKMVACMDKVRPWEQGYFHVLSTWAALLEENGGKALLHAEKNIQLIPEMGTLINTAQIHLAMALACLLANKADKASQYFEITERLAEKTQDKQTIFSNLLAQAWVAQHEDNKNGMIDYLRKGLAIGKAQGYVNSFFWNVQKMERLCYIALQENIEERYVQNLIRTRQIAPPVRSIALETWPWKIKLFTLGRFSLLIDDKPVQFPKKAQGRPLDLLYVLIAFGGRNISREKIADCLWPDALGDAAISSLSTTLQRLRKLLTIPEAIIVQHGTITLNPRFCWVDIWTFERLISAAATLTTNQSEKQLFFLQKAVALYHGLFLQEQGNEYWLQQTRERLHLNFSQISIQIADRLVQKQNYIHAIGFLEKAIAIDPVNITRYQQLMEDYSKEMLNDKVQQIDRKPE